MQQQNCSTNNTNQGPSRMGQGPELNCFTRTARY